MKRAALQKVIPEKPKYIGQGLRQTGNKIFYEAMVIKGNQCIRPGDSLLLQSGEVGGTPYICRCTEIWCDVTKEEAMLKGQWFYRKTDIEKKYFDPSIPTGDVEIYLSNESQPNSAETVLSKIVVIYNDDTIEVVRQKKERSKLLKLPLFFCNYKYTTRVKKGASHFSKLKAQSLRIPEMRMLSVKAEHNLVTTSHRRGDAAQALLRKSSGTSGSHGGTMRAKRTHTQAILEVPPLLGLERRKSVEFIDPLGGEYTYTVHGGSSFKEDGTMVAKKRRKTKNTNGKRKFKFPGEFFDF